jgi:hypothetical protein
MNVKVFFAVVVTVLSLTGCASEQLTKNELDTGTDMSISPLRDALVSISMIRYYDFADMPPVNYEPSAATIALNDTLATTASSSLGGTHGIIIPMVSISPTRAAQNTLTLSATQPFSVQEAETGVLRIAAKDFQTYKEGPEKDGCIYGQYECHNGPGSRITWVDKNKDDMNRLISLYRALHGDSGIKAQDITVKDDDIPAMDKALRRLALAISKKPTTTPVTPVPSGPQYFIQ